MLTNRERNWVVATNSECLITISLQPDVVDFLYFKLWILLDQIVWKFEIRFTLSGCKDIGIGFWQKLNNLAKIALILILANLHKEKFLIHN